MRLRTATLALLTVLTLANAKITAAPPPAITPPEKDYLTTQLTQFYSDSPYAARVGICAVILHRMNSPRYPDTVAAVVEGLRREGEFTKITPAEDPDSSARISTDALSMALDGADPSNGATHFRRIEKKLQKPDFRQPESREDDSKIGNILFY